MQTKTTLRFHLTPIEWQLSGIHATATISVGEDVGEKVHSYFPGGNANWCNHYGKKYGDSLENVEWNNHLAQSSHWV